MFKPGDIVLCIKSFDPDIFGPTAPLAGCDYVVTEASDACGCGFRIVLRDCHNPTSQKKWTCGSCFVSFNEPRVVGWNKNFFIKIGNETFESISNFELLGGTV